MPAFAGNTHPGRVRSGNEDAIGWQPERGLWFVADGMGGHASGEVASRIVSDTLLAGDGGAPLEQAIVDAHRAIVGAAEGDEALKGMGATVVAVQMDGATAHVVWVGDSRAYLWRRGRISRISRDHSFVELLREREGKTEEDLRDHPNRNIVTQTLGLADPKPSAVDLTLKRGDWILLCSDGLNDELTDDEIAAALKRSDGLETAVQQLIDAALASGGRDNVSVVLVAYDGDGFDWRGRLAQAWQRLWHAHEDD